MEQIPVTDTMVILSLEIITLLTGETFAAVRSGELVAIMAPQHQFMIPERIGKQPLLQLVNELVEQVMGKDEDQNYIKVETKQEEVEVSVSSGQRSAEDAKMSWTESGEEKTPVTGDQRSTTNVDLMLTIELEESSTGGSTERGSTMERSFEERQSPSPSFQMDITEGGENPNELMIDAENRSADQSPDPSVPSVPISFSDLSFPCSEAEKSIALDISLMEHLIVYKGRRYHSCPECGKRFLREQTLREHQHVHSGEKPFICSDCGKCFSKNMQLADHQRRMHTKRYHRLLKKLSNQKRLAYTIPFKLEVVNYAKEHGNRAAERHFGPPPTEKMIREWRKQEEQLQKADLNKHTFRKHPARWPQLDTDMQEWLARHRDNGFSVSAKMIMYEAKRIAGEKGVQDFTGSPSWCYRFMQRCGLALRNKTRIKQKMPKEYESKILSFHKMVIDARKQDDFQMSQIGNMDEVPLTFDVPFNRSVDVEGGENLAVKTSVHEKFRCTVVLSCCADGTKLPPMLIFKRKSAPTEEVPEGVVVHVHSKGWMDENGMTVWVEEVWSKRPGGLLKRPSLLVLDEFRAHVCETAKRSFRESKTRLAVIPWGLTSQLQPLDVSVNKPFKGLMAEEWNKWVAAAQLDPTPTGRMKRPSIAQVCEWVKTAWQTVTGEAVARSFKKCGISNALDGTEDALVYEDSEESDASDCEPMGFLNSDTSDDEFEKST